MDQQGEYRIPATQADVWQALNDPAVLARCIPGCQSMEKTDDTHFSARVKAKVGPVSATFEVLLELADVQAPSSYRIDGQVKGGPAGFGKGGARVALEAVSAAETRLTYQVEASIGGKLAQVGSRLIDAATRKMADEFFQAFCNEVGQPLPATTGGETEVVATADIHPESGTASPPKRFEASDQWKIWAVVFGLFIVAMLLAL